MIKIENLNKYYNKGKKNQIHVINNTSIELPDKGLVTLLGASGCGKTTLLNVIGGLDRVNKGNIYINGKKITSRLTRKVDKIRNLNLGYIFQDYKLIDNLSVYENVEMVLKMIGIKDKKEIKVRVDYILEKLGIYRYRYRPCGMLSGGERQRVGIARALVKNPDIILADEPTGNLDSKNTIEIMNIIKSISHDKLVIMVTHDVKLVNFYADRIIEIVDGKIVNDRENDDANELDYYIDNKFYLQDFKFYKENTNNDINVKYYNDEDEKLDLVIVVRNGNIYIKNNSKKKVEVIDNSSNIAFINDSYKKLDKSIYEKYNFDFKNIINKDIKYKYSSIFNIWTIFSLGFKKVFGYSIAKKILLLGFFLSGMFVTFAISNTLGIVDINDYELMVSNKTYLSYGKKISVSKYLEYEKYDGVNFLLPGNGYTDMNIVGKKYYQTYDIENILNVYLASYDLLSQEDLLYGRMPTNSQEVVIDKMIYNEAMNYMLGLEMVGLYDVDELVGTHLYSMMGECKYTIVGVTDLGSNTLYTDKSQFFKIINSSNEYSSYEGVSLIKDYNIYKDRLEIVSGREPRNDYEVIISDNLSDTYKLNNKIKNYKVNGEELKVVGYYGINSNIDFNGYFVNENTKKYNMIEEAKSITISTNDKEKVMANFLEEGIELTDVYEDNKNEYLFGLKLFILISLSICGCIFVVSLVEIILMMRSSFLSRIKEVGIYRAIGVKKSDIYKMFIGEIVAISTLTSLPGCLLMCYCLNLLSGIPSIGVYYLMNGFVCILCIIFIYGFNILFGLGPVIDAMKKTPAEILARHEVD